MELTNEFEVGTDIGQAWEVLTDLERIAPCLPGAELRGIDGDEFTGVVKVKVGPITTEYKGSAHFLELDPDAHRAVLLAKGRETRGQGNAAATITASLSPSDKGTTVSVVTDLSITGKVAQFGRGVLADVSAKLLAQFVDNLESMVLAGDRSPAAPAAHRAAANGSAEGSASEYRAIDPAPAEPVDLIDVAGSSVAKRLAPVVFAVTLAVVLFLLRRRRSGASG